MCQRGYDQRGQSSLLVFAVVITSDAHLVRTHTRKCYKNNTVIEVTFLQSGVGCHVEHASTCWILVVYIIGLAVALTVTS